MNILAVDQICNKEIDRQKDDKQEIRCPQKHKFKNDSQYGNKQTHDKKNTKRIGSGALPINKMREWIESKRKEVMKRGDD